MCDRFMTSKQRALEKEAKNKQDILGENPYNDRARRDPFTRRRLKHKEFGHDMRYRGHRTENERVAYAVEFNNKRDHSQRDTKMIHNPNWRTGVNSKFKGELKRDGSKQSFKYAKNKFELKNKAAWDEIPFRIEDDENGVYVDGLEQLGNNLSLKQREKHLELSKKNQFISDTRPNIWDSTQKASQTIRTKIVDDLRGVTPVYDEFSKNKHLKHYKKNLVASRNVDKIIPFKHSQK